MSKNELPLFAYVVFPIEEGYYYFVPFSDSLRALIHGLQTKVLGSSETISQDSIEIGGSIALRADLVTLSTFFQLDATTFRKLLMGLINEKGGGFVTEPIDVYGSLPHACNLEGNGRVEYSGERIRFSFKLDNGSSLRTYPLTIQGFNTLVLESYQNYLDKQ